MLIGEDEQVLPVEIVMAVPTLEDLSKKKGKIRNGEKKASKLLTIQLNTNLER